ncbi:MAG: MCE family protein [Deltaproteobacteria bacterium]|jgi:paraquat-inducible protein B|nr:MCE family protein [Deltaproteobacteria bacterium]
MAEGKEDSDGANAASSGGVRDAVVEQRSRISLVWVIPIVAALVGAWLTYHTFSQRGPAVTISFESAEGLEAGKTKVKYKDVEVGAVESIELSEDLSHVIVTARLVKPARRYLRESTRFWVVRAQVSAGRVSGLSTLFSGAYIGIDPAFDGESRRAFEGLNAPPVVTSDEAGTLFTLRSTDIISIEVGAPVYFHTIKVGQVANYELDESGEFVTVTVFIQAPNDTRVGPNTQFWNVSGIDVSLSAEGVEVDTVSLTSLLIGGIAFDTPSHLETDGPVAEGTVFNLYKNRRATTEPVLGRGNRFLLEFEQSVAGLSKGAPVQFRGIKIGQVLDVKLVFDLESATPRVPVLIETHPELIQVTGREVGTPIERWQKMVERGMRAQLQTGNLITGQLLVSLDFFPDAPPAAIDWSGPVPQLPTIPSPIEELKAGLTQFVKRLSSMPLEQIGANLNQTLRELRALSGSLNEEMMPSLIATLDEAQRTLASADSLIAPDSDASVELKRLLFELAEAAQAIRRLAVQLEEHPESLIRGKKGAEQ